VSTNWDKIWNDLSYGMSLNPAREVRYDAILNSIKCGSVLDYGAGDGDLVIKLRKLGHNVKGVEMSLEGIRIGNKKARELGFDELLFPLNDEVVYGTKFDNIILSEILEHLEYPAILLNDLTKSLNIDGQLIITVPAGPISYFDRFIGHFRHYNRKSLASEIQNANLDLIKMKKIGFPIVNIVRVWCILRREKILQDVSTPSIFINNKTFKKILHVFYFFGKFNTFLGWQLIAVAKLKSSDNNKVDHSKSE
jgi:SAM-dependent methyltransferase